MGSIIALLVVLAPIIFYSYKSSVFPSSKVMETPFFTLTSSYYENIQTFVWVFLGKAVPLYLFIIWFLTCRYWWFWAILSPIGMYVFQLVSLFNDEFKLKDEPIDLLYIIPYMIVVSAVLIFIRHKLKSYIMLFNVKEQIETEIEKIENNEI